MSTPSLNHLRCVDLIHLFQSLNECILGSRLAAALTCFVCTSSGFNNLSNLKEHKRTHATDKTFTCDQCGKSFNTHRKLLKHKARHSGEKPHSCATCGEWQNSTVNTLWLKKMSWFIISKSCFHRWLQGSVSLARGICSVTYGHTLERNPTFAVLVGRVSPALQC